MTRPKPTRPRRKSNATAQPAELAPQAASAVAFEQAAVAAVLRPKPSAEWIEHDQENRRWLGARENEARAQGVGGEEIDAVFSDLLGDVARYRAGRYGRIVADRSDVPRFASHLLRKDVQLALQGIDLAVTVLQAVGDKKLTAELLDCLHGASDAIAKNELEALASLGQWGRKRNGLLRSTGRSDAKKETVAAFIEAMRRWLEAMPHGSQSLQETGHAQLIGDAAAMWLDEIGSILVDQPRADSRARVRDAIRARAQEHSDANRSLQRSVERWASATAHEYVECVLGAWGVAHASSLVGNAI